MGGAGRPNSEATSDQLDLGRAAGVLAEDRLGAGGGVGAGRGGCAGSIGVGEGGAIPKSDARESHLLDFSCSLIYLRDGVGRRLP